MICIRYQIFSNSSCPLLNIWNIGYSADPNITRFGPGVRDYYIIHFVISGKGYFNGNCVSAGQGFLITPNMHEQYYPDEKEPWDFLWVISNDDKMSTLFEYFQADVNTNIFRYDYSHAVKDVSSFLIANHNTIYNAFEMLEIFIRIFKHQQTEILANTTKTNAAVYIEAAEQHIISNTHRPITVSELIEFLGISQPYLFKIFKERFSKSPKQFIMEQKLNQAKKLLKETDMSVTNIANSVGFQDVLSFSKCFRTKIGCSPQNYRSETTKKP